MTISNVGRFLLAALVGAAVVLAALPPVASAQKPAGAGKGQPPKMICVVEGMGSRISEGTLCQRLERLIGFTMVMRDDPWARDAQGTVRIIGGDVDVLVAVAWRKRRIAWARRSWMELGSSYLSVLGLTVYELLPLEVVKRAKQLQAEAEDAYHPADILHSEIIDPWELSRMPRGAGLLPWEKGKKKKKK